jgi:superfamily I DNA/RNA helicase
VAVILGLPLTGKTTRLVLAYQQHLASGFAPNQILCLSFYSVHAAALRRALRSAAGGFLPWVTTLQRFQTLLLRGYARAARLPRRTREIQPSARALLLRQAWAAIDGPLWHAFGAGPSGPRPGALAEFTRVVDWLSANRTGFRAEPGELSQHELARAYAGYLAACDRYGLLTFQEASLRCLDLLSDPAVAADIGRRFPVVLVDDVHLARPDQLRLIDRLRAVAVHFTASAWLEPEAAAPELRTAWEFVQSWRAPAQSPAENLAPAPGVNPAIFAVIRRATRPFVADSAVTVPAVPIALHVAFTVEDELHAVAQAIVRALLADPTLKPSDIALISPAAGLLPFAARILQEYGLPVTPPRLAARHTPLVRGALLILRWLRNPGQRGALEAELLSLPFVALDPLARHLLLRAAALAETAPLALPADTLSALGLNPDSLARLEALRSALGALGRTQPASRLADEALAALSVSAWMRTDKAFDQAERAEWERLFVEWRRMMRDTEALLAAGLPEPDDWIEHLETLADDVIVPGGPSGVQLVPRGLTNGVRARCAFVVGLAEDVIPRQQPVFQLLPEADLPGLFATNVPVSLPLARDKAAWIEREARELSALLSRGTERLWLSTSRYSTAGEAQLPSPFFERLLGADGDIDRDGQLTLTRTGLFEWQPQAAPDAPEVYLPQLALAPLKPATAEPGARLLHDHTYSASQMRAYLTCPLQFYYQRVLGLETEGSSALDRGGLIHELLCVAAGDGALRDVRLWDRPRPAWMNSSAALNERVLAALEAAWNGQAADLPGGGHYQPGLAWGQRFGPELQRRAVRRWAERVASGWAEYEVAGFPDRANRRPVLLEAGFRFEQGPYRLVGRVDRIDEIQTPAGPRYEVIDYKTGRGGESLTDHLAKFLPLPGEPPADYQLPIYALAMMSGGVDGLKQVPRALNLVFVETLERTKRGGYSAKACRTVQLVEGGAVDARSGSLPLGVLTGEVAQGMQATLSRMAASPYPAQPGRHCAYCAFRAACERGRAGEETA